jgi:TP901 family phage tail tape measure protein
MPELFTLFGRIVTNAPAAIAEIGAVTGAAATAGASMNKSFAGVGASIKGLAGAAGLGAVIYGFATLARAGVDNIAHVNAATRQFRIDTGASAAEAERFRTTLMEMHREGAETWENEADKMTMIRRRWGDLGDGLKQYADLFEDFEHATGVDAPAAVNLLTDVLLAFNKPLSEVGPLMDMLKTASEQSGRPVTELASALAHTSMQLQAANVPLKDGIAFLAMLQKRGVDASAASRGLMMAVNMMVNPTKAGAAAWKTLGVEVDGAGRPLKDGREVLLQLIKVLGDGQMSQEKFAAASTIFSRRGAMEIIRGMAGGTKAIEDMTAALDKSQGATKKAADIYEQALGVRMEKFKRQVWEPLIDDIGRRYIGALTSALSWMEKVPPPMVQAAAKTMLFDAAMLAIVISLPKVVVGVKLLMGVLSGPAGIIGLLLGLAAAAWYASDAFDAEAKSGAAAAEAAARAKFLGPAAKAPEYQQAAQALERMTAAQERYTKARRLEGAYVPDRSIEQQRAETKAALAELTAATKAYNEAQVASAKIAGAGVPAAPPPPPKAGGAKGEARDFLDLAKSMETVLELQVRMAAVGVGKITITAAEQQLADFRQREGLRVIAWAAALDASGDPKKQKRAQEAREFGATMLKANQDYYGEMIDVQKQAALDEVAIRGGAKDEEIAILQDAARGKKRLYGEDSKEYAAAIKEQTAAELAWQEQLRTFDREAYERDQAALQFDIDTTQKRLDLAKDYEEKRRQWMIETGELSRQSVLEQWGREQRNLAEMIAGLETTGELTPEQQGWILEWKGRILQIDRDTREMRLAMHGEELSAIEAEISRTLTGYDTLYQRKIALLEVGRAQAETEGKLADAAQITAEIERTRTEWLERQLADLDRQVLSVDEQRAALTALLPIYQGHAQAIRAIEDRLRTVYEQLLAQGFGLRNLLIGAGQGIESAFTSFFQGAMQQTRTLGDLWRDLVSAIESEFAGMLTKLLIHPFFERLERARSKEAATKAGGTAQAATDALPPALQAWAQAANALIPGLGGWVSSAAQLVIGFFVQQAATAVQTAAAITMGITAATQVAAGGLMVGASVTMGLAAAAMMTAAATYATAAAASSIIPFLQHGGLVTRPTLAMVGEAGPEAVIPLSHFRQLGHLALPHPIGDLSGAFAGGRGVQVGPVTVHNYLTPDALDAAGVQRLADRMTAPTARALRNALRLVPVGG